MKNKKGFTLSEIIIALFIVTVVVSLMLVVNRRISNVSTMGIKKASQTLNDVVQELLDDMNYYNGVEAFGDLSSVKLQDGEPVFGETKFKDLFRNLVKLNSNFATGNVLLCPTLVSESQIENNSQCFMTADGIVWGVPNTDFRTKNIIKITRNGYETPYFPITVYSDCKIGEFNANGVARCEKDIDHDAYFDENAVVFILRKDGDIRIFSRLDCKNPAYKNSPQCRAADIISQTSF